MKRESNVLKQVPKSAQDAVATHYIDAQLLKRARLKVLEGDLTGHDSTLGLLVEPEVRRWLDRVTEPA
jgi:hypothetical protein